MDIRSGSSRRRERVEFETDRHRVVGDVTLPPEGYQARLSDAINRPEVSFLPLTDVEITPLDGGPVKRQDFALLAKAHVRFAHSVGEPRE